jgi:hypothetical protein
MSANRIVWAALLVGIGASVGLAQSTVPPPTSLFGGSPKPPLPGSRPELTQAQAVAPPLAAVPPAMDTLTTPVTNPGLPGAVYSPWCGDQPAGGCNGPIGANGNVTYEGYLRTGPALVLGGGELSAILKTGWNVQGGSRTLFFNPTGDAAWVLDLGIGFTRNQGRRLDRTSQLFLVGDPNPQTRVNGPDVLAEVGVRGLSRTSLNFAVGRDYFLNGPGVVGQNEYGNVRWGWDVGGRWGTTSIDLEPADDPGGYRRRQDVYHGLFLGSQLNWEKPLGSWTFLVGARLEWSYYWTNIVPPRDGDFRDLNILMMFGVRF